MPNGTGQFDAVLFDMGGVLVELAPLHDLLGRDGLSADEFWAAWLSSPAVRALEAGRCDVTEFAAGLIEELDLPLSTDDVVARFLDFPRGLYPGAAELVASVPHGVTTGLLSNTNDAHWQHQRDGERIRSLCDRNYLSFRIGALKPDAAIFEHVIADLGAEPGRVLFIDDNRINVDGARAAGLQAAVAKGPAGAAAELARRGLTNCR